jgi:hypothetical protein
MSYYYTPHEPLDIQTGLNSNLGKKVILVVSVLFVGNAILRCYNPSHTPQISQKNRKVLGTVNIRNQKNMLKKKIIK